MSNDKVRVQEEQPLYKWARLSLDSLENSPVINREVIEGGIYHLVVEDDETCYGVIELATGEVISTFDVR